MAGKNDQFGYQLIYTPIVRYPYEIRSIDGKLWGRYRTLDIALEGFDGAMRMGARHAGSVA